MEIKRTFIKLLFGLATVAIIIACKNPSLNTGTDLDTGANLNKGTEYPVTYDLNGGSGATVPTDSEVYAAGQDVTAAAKPVGLTHPAGKSFAGWNTQANGSGTDVAAGGTISMPNGDLTLYAKWVDSTYSVAYDLNGGSGATVPTDSGAYAAGQDVTAAAKPEGLTHPAGKSFDGWNTQADGSGTDVAAGGTISMPSGGLTLYAQWVVKYSVTYDLNGGSGATVPTDSVVYAAGQDVTAAAKPVGLAAPSAGKSFAGWNTRSNGKGDDVAPGGTISMSKGGLTLYAKWTG